MMGVTATIQIKFYSAHLPGNLFAALRNGEWDFDAAIVYEHYQNTADIGNWKYASLESSEETFALLDQYHELGETVGVHFYWRDPAVFTAATVDAQGDMVMYFYGLRPQLPQLRFTDYGWLLQRILPPLLNAGCNINLVRCEDEI